MAGDISQIAVVAKNEMIKCVRGRKFMISLAIVLLVFLLITGLQLLIGTWDNMKDIGALIDVYIDNLPMIIVLVVALLSSIAIVSEFEERTALILFTRPVRRTSIFIGKLLACTIIEAMIILTYYILVIIVGMIKIGSVPIDFFTSFAFAALYAFAASGIAFIISSFFKKGSVCTVVSILLLIVIFPIISAMMTTDGGDNWFMMDQASDTIYTSIPEYVDRYNENIEQFDNVIQSAVDILKGFTDESLSKGIGWIAMQIFSPEFFLLDEKTQTLVIQSVFSGYSDAMDQYEQYFDPDYFALPDHTTQVSVMRVFTFLTMTADGNLSGMIRVLEMLSNMSALQPIEYPDLVKNALVLIVWAIVGYFIAWARFIKKEF